MDQAEKLGDGTLSIYFSKSEKEELDISHSSGSSSESFDFSIERFCRSIR